LPLVLADARSAAVLAPAPDALVLADARSAAVLALALLPLVLAPARSPVRSAPFFGRCCSGDLVGHGLRNLTLPCSLAAFDLHPRQVSRCNGLLP